MGGDHHGEHHHKTVIPDYRIYKVEDAPELVRVQKELAKLGLKDPWLRNEVWRYNRKEFGTPSSKMSAMFSKGFKYGLILFGITTAIETAADFLNPKMPHHGHH
ncbi:NADH dehydrogenase [ubiquinone] 1 beta subcomplex subunit 3-like [Macrosteles quadrilineatus]|uniref:NADH dehydrogenase [ubiquinone] 1 beta subcomplex subunit 3-like n=1 Tax=Macrosteles quadrilineatus TaxID=74068 RepID=UPI0023E2D66C|nr:NADH dehydrogenase [ubiquinone] 1 beta subcomplex subunit 3-like [Macrosteles quadrilineatus]XP_054275454.1 NADH dehydrogenase [ubiquinone] 1 beta subcomplex subunit 3-like [Macrosteles quadrilineatus]XP_054275968.1 NADH dehydrogenase [ubiquinone] 1 beta subcomplex subunit 3-like [Macrosteles quadrilineatus]XP_054275969.1 NADH dehydrogenase [ubiquinone] 1 beta subcomplex subunit 3-like [Macrosteles quadrilineatus]